MAVFRQVGSDDGLQNDQAAECKDHEDTEVNPIGRDTQICGNQRA